MKVVITKKIRLLLGCTVLPAIMAAIVPAASAEQTWYRQSGGTATISNQVFTSDVDDTSGVFVTNGGVLTMTNCTIRTTGNTSKGDNSSFYGLNAGVLANKCSKLTMTGCNIYTEGEGGNGVFATDSGTVITLFNDTITCLGNLGHGVDATFEGTLNLTDVIIVTKEAHGAPISTDRGGGTIIVKGGNFSAAGSGSPGIYCTGDITVSDAVVGATGSGGVVIEGENTVTMTNVTLSGAKGTSNRGNLIYQSTSGDAEGKKGVYNMTGGSFTWQETGPVYFITNTTAYINLNGVTFYSSSDTLIKSCASRWGTSGKNGGETYLTAEKQQLTGLAYTDAISSTSITLKTGSSWSGWTNLATVSIDETSSWNVTATSGVSSFTDPSAILGDSVTNVTGNGYNVYYDSTVTGNDYLQKKTYKLTGGGYLTCGAGTTAVCEGAEASASASVFPNPASSELHIITGKESEQQLSICNLFGEHIYDRAITGGLSIDVGKWPDGVYFVMMNGGVYRVIVRK